MDTNQEEFNGMDDLDVQNVNEEEVTEPKTRSFLKGAILTKGGTDGQESGTEGTDGETVQTRGANDDPEPAPAEHDPPVPTRSSNGPVSIISDKLGQDHPIHAKQLEDTKTVTLTGDITGTGHWNFAGAETMDTDISENAVTNRELAANSVVGAAGGSSGSSQKSNIVSGSIGFTDINSGAIDTTVTTSNNKLVTSGAVKTAINNAVLARGTTYGPKTISEINALSNINDGSTVHVSGLGTATEWEITDGIDPDGPQGAVHTTITVRKGADLRYVATGSVQGWYSLDGEFKLKQSQVNDPTVPTSGTTESISFIDSITQDENGEISPSKKNVRQASTSQTGVVQLSNATDSSDETKAATPKAVSDVKAIADGKLDPVNAVSNPNADGTGIDFVDSVTQATTGQIEVHRKTVRSATTSQSGLMSASDKGKLDGLKTGSEYQAALDNKKNKQTAITTDPAADGNGLTFVDSVQQNDQGVITVHRKTVKEATSETSAGAGNATSGIMSASDKDKLDKVSAGATKVEASETNGNIKIDGVETNVYTHPSAGATSHGSKGDTQNQTPGFGETFKSISATVDTDGHTTALAEHTVKIPDALATPSTGGTGGTKGLMSAADKEKLDNIEASADVNQNAFSNIKVGTATISAATTTDTFELAKGTNTTLTVDAASKKITIDTVSQAATATPNAVASAGAVGTSTKYAREDHVHPISVATGSTSGTVTVAGQEVGVKDWDTKADKVTMTSGHAGNFASLDANGNIQDSGHKHTDYKTVQTAVSDPTSSGTNDALTFISGITQNAQGVITPTKKAIRGATTEQSGVVELAGSIGATVAEENNKAASEKAVRDAINALDVTEVGAAGKYIQAIGETDGKISPTVETAETDAVANSKKLITAGGVFKAISDLDVTDTAVSHKFVTAVSETDGKISVTRAQPGISDVDGLQSALNDKQPNLAFDGTYNAESNKAATVSSVTSRIADLDATVNSSGATGVTPNFGIQVVETDGKITSVKVTSDGTEKASNKAQSITTGDTSTTNYPSNKAVADFVNSSISTATANFLGTYDVVSDLELTTSATNSEIATALAAKHPWTAAGKTATNNDYVFVSINLSTTTDVDEFRRFKFDGTDWLYEYTLNNSSFTQAQWDAINSGLTATDKTTYNNHLSNTNNPHQVTKAQVGLGNVDNKQITVSATDGVTNVTDGITYKYTHPTATAHTAAAVKVGNDATGHVVIGSALEKGDVGLGNVDNKSVATIKTEFTGAIENNNTGFVTGDAAYDALADKQDNLAAQTAYTAKGTATKVPQITTNALGQVTKIEEVTITGVAPASHTHGNIQNGGTLQNNDVTIGRGDKLVITDDSDGGKITRTSTEFDGSTTTKALTPKGTFETFLQASDIEGKADKTATVSDVAIASNGQSIQKTINGSTTEVAKLDGVYNASTNKIATQSTVSTAVSTAVNALDAAVESSDGTNVQVKVTETDGKITAVNITTDNTEVNTHTHGNINRNGTISGDGTAIATGDKLIVADASDSGKVIKSTIAFDGTTATQALTKKGTWETINNQNVFSKVKVGSTEIVADSTADTLELAAGSGITLTPDASNDKVTIAHTNSLTAGTIGSSSASSGVTLQVPYASYDANGHITGKGTHTHTVPAATTSASGVTTLQDTIGATESTSNKAATPKAVRDAINELDVNSAGGEGKYIKSISEADGKIVPVEETMDTVPTEGSNKAATSGGIWSELDKKVNVDDMVAVTGRGTYDGTTHRLTFNDIIFDNIYPVVGKYGLAVFSETSAVNAAESSGDKEWLLDWRPYLIDMSAVQGETAKTPVAELKPGNWLRKTDGSYATVCGITSTQATALDNKSDTLKFGTRTGSSSTVATLVQGVYTGNTFNPAVLWEYLNTAEGLAAVNTAAGKSYTCAIEVEITDGTNTYKYGSYTDYHIPAPWETTETKYSVFIGRTSDVYVIDGVYSGTSTDTTNNSLYMRGLAAKPVPVGVDGFDPEFFRLRRTGISPGPSTTVGGKIRNFFYNYSGSDSNTHGYPTANATCFKDNGTYPRTADTNQYTTVKWARSCNSGGENGSAVPVSEGGYHSLNAFLCSIEAAYKARDVFAVASKFSSGVSSNDTTENGVWNGSAYAAWNNGTYGTDNANNHYSKFQCMEPQIAASLAAEMGLAANAEFQWNGGTWHYEIPTLDGIKTLADNKMNCRIYKKITEGLSSAVPSGGYYMLRCALAEGVNPVGDIWWCQGGGCEIVYETTGTGTTDYQYSFYLEPDQSRWISGTYVTSSTESNEKHTDNTKFTAETQYKAVITDSIDGGTNDAYCLSRTGYSPLRKVAGGDRTTGECCYQYRSIADDAQGSAGIRSRRRVLFRGDANSGDCSPRYLFAYGRPSYTYVSFGCAAQVLLA